MLELDDSVVVGTLVLFIVIFICTVVWCWRKMLSISWQEHRTEVRVAVCLYVRGTPMSALTHNIRTICLYQSTRSHSALFKCCSIKFPVSFNLELFFTFISRQCAYWHVLSSFVQIFSRFPMASQLPRPA